MSNADTVGALTSRPPDFFIVGAPKSATSSLHLLLVEHPDVFMCSPKEPHFFCSDLPGLAEVSDRAAYDALFSAAPEAVIRGEASAHYLASSQAAARIREVNPDARIVLSLRNPIDAARSYYHQLRDGFREDRPTFEEAWELQGERAAGRALPPYCPEPGQLQYRALYSYADQVVRYLDAFPREQILILRFEDIVHSPESVTDRVVEFLGLPPLPDGVTLLRTNTRREPRFPWLAQLAAAPPAPLRPFLAPAKRLLNGVGIKPSVIMMRHLSRPAVGGAGKDEEPAFRAQLIAAFEEDVRRLEDLLALDLSEWRQ